MMCAAIVVGACTLIPGSERRPAHAATPSPAPRFTPEFNFPRLFSYSRFGNASGLPYVTNGPDGESRNGTPNLSAINATARNQAITLMTEPATANYIAKGSNSVISKMRAANPGALLLAYWWTDFPWTTADQNADPHVVGEAVRYIKQQHWYLVNQAGGEWGGAFGPINLDFANPQFVTWYIDYIATRIHDTGLWDGIFFDNFCDTISWMDAGQVGTNKMSLTQHGHTYASWTEFDADHKIGLTNFIRGLRQRVGNQYVLAGNCGLGGQYDSINGSMSERFPQFGSGVTKWAYNIFLPDGGYVEHDALVQPPTFNFLTHFIPTCTQTSGGNCVAWDESLATNASALQSVRYALTSALLGNGYYFPDEDRSPNSGWAANTWWYDEFDNAGQGTGYLGQPTSIPYQIIDLTKLSATEYLVNGGFEAGNSGSWSTAAAGSGNRWDVETSDVHSGTYALRATVPDGSALWYTEVARQTLSGVPTNNTYSATFWAKADRQRKIRVQIDNAGSSDAYQNIELDTAWHQYQVTASVAATNNLVLSFYVGGEAGDVWIDSASFNQGTGHVWARDFDHGTSFINPGISGSMTFPIVDSAGQARSMQHINGTQDHTVNNGQVASSLTIPANDGVIMLSTTNPPTNVSQCTEQWSCTGWTCQGGHQVRTCTDANACRTTANKPAEVGASCGSPVDVNLPPPSPTDTTPPARVTDLKAQ